MLTPSFRDQLEAEARTRRTENREIVERALASPQGSRVELDDGRDLLNLCANDYLGFANSAELRAIATAAQERWGLASAAGRIISGTFGPHRELERRLSAFLASDDSVLFASCFDANVGLFESITGAEDAIFSDSHNHASIIDGIRLSKARRYTYPSRDLSALRESLIDHGESRRRVIVTDGVFSMDGGTADVGALCDIADEFEALLVVDDSHGLGTVGDHGRGSVNVAGVEGRVDIITGTIGKSLGGVGGFISGHGPLIEAVRQTSRPYLFSNSIPAAYAEVAVAALDIMQGSPERHEKLAENTAHVRSELARLGLDVSPGHHPIIAIIVGDEEIALAAKTALLAEGIMVAALTFPVVARGSARLRVQVSAEHDRNELTEAAWAIAEAVTHAAP